MECFFFNFFIIYCLVFFFFAKLSQTHESRQTERRVRAETLKRVRKQKLIVNMELHNEIKGGFDSE